MKKICFYYHHINSIGGVEIAILNLIKKLSNDYKIYVAYSYSDSDLEMILRISEYAEIVNLKHSELEVDTVIYCSIYCQKEKIKAKRSLRWVHGCLTDMKTKLPKENIDDYISVGKICKDQLDTQLLNKESHLIFNELNSDIHNLSKEKIKGKKDKLHLVTVSRISPEKGFERMLEVSKILSDSGIKHTWDIIGNGYNKSYEEKIKSIAPKEWIFHGKKDVVFLYQS